MTETEINFWLIRLGLLASAIKDAAEVNDDPKYLKKLIDINLAIISDLVHILEYNDHYKIQVLQEKWQNLPHIEGRKVL